MWSDEFHPMCKDMNAHGSLWARTWVATVIHMGGKTHGCHGNLYGWKDPWESM